MLIHQVKGIDGIHKHENGKEQGEYAEYKIGKTVAVIDLCGKHSGDKKRSGVKTAGQTDEEPRQPQQYKKCIGYINQYLVKGDSSFSLNHGFSGLNYFQYNTETAIKGGHSIRFYRSFYITTLLNEHIIW